MFNKCIYLCEPAEVNFDDWKGEVHYVKVIDIYDGDTITIKTRRNGVWIKEKVRMVGYDSPEMKPSLQNPNRLEEKKRAIMAREALVEKCLNKKAWMVCHGKDKYGRILGELFLSTFFGKEEKSLNKWMIENGHGVEYSGGTKKEWNFDENLLTL